MREGYALYQLVRHCNEIPRGYALQYVNDDELDRATASIKMLVRKAKKDEPHINTGNQQPCQRYLGQLLQMNPVYNDEKPPECLDEHPIRLSHRRWSVRLGPADPQGRTGCSSSYEPQRSRNAADRRASILADRGARRIAIANAAGRSAVALMNV